MAAEKGTSDTPSMALHAQALCAAASLALAGAALYEVPTEGMVPEARQWWLLLGALVLALLAFLRQPLDFGPDPPAQRPSGRLRWVAGLLLALGGAALWIEATRNFYLDWHGAFDRTWISWVVGTVLLGVGLDMVAGRWQAPPISTRVRRLAMLGLTLAAAGAVRLANVQEFPGPAGITQIEDLQFGNWGAQFLAGHRSRWEFIGHAWVSALAIWFGGAEMASIRTGYAVVGTLTVGAVMLWLRASAGTVAAVIGTAFFVVSSWDAVVSRIGFIPNTLTISLLFALLVGPARRGRPSAFAWMGLLSGYLLWEYIGYRPAAVFALAGGAFLSLRERAVGWPMRVGRPLLMMALICAIGLPLFGNRIKGRVGDEYLNGINRARGQRHYYNESFDWQKVVDLRLKRSLDTTALLYFLGDKSPARNVERRPLVDAASSTAMMLGFAYCLANPLSQLVGLFAGGFVLTAVGVMVVAADFNPLRFSVAMPYLYYFAGLGGFALLRLWGRAWGKLGRILAVAVVALGVSWAAYDNFSFLGEYWSSKKTRKAVHSQLAYLTNWIGRNVRDGEQVIGAAGRSSVTLLGNDAAWLRGRKVPGNVEWDITTALERWDDPGPTLFLLYSGKDTRDTAKLVEHLLPDLEMTVLDHELGSDLAFARVDDRPAAVDSALERMRCRGVRVTYEFVGKGGAVLKTIERVEPLVGLSTWPSEIVRTFHRGVRPDRLRMTYRAKFRIDNAGEYRFEPNYYHGKLALRIDGQTVKAGGKRFLEAGTHELEGVADMVGLPGGTITRLLWSGPDSGNRAELMPFYRITDPLPSCPSVVVQGAPD